jgi:hypothetical protein
MYQNVQLVMVAEHVLINHYYYYFDLIAKENNCLNKTNKLIKNRLELMVDAHQYFVLIAMDDH